MDTVPSITLIVSPLTLRKSYSIDWETEFQTSFPKIREAPNTEPEFKTRPARLLFDLLLRSRPLVPQTPHSVSFFFLLPKCI